MDWWKHIYEALKHADVRQVAYVPDAGHASLIEACVRDTDIRAIALTSEEEGVAVVAGATLVIRKDLTDLLQVYSHA